MEPPGENEELEIVDLSIDPKHLGKTVEEQPSIRHLPQRVSLGGPVCHIEEAHSCIPPTMYQLHCMCSLVSTTSRLLVDRGANSNVDSSNRLPITIDCEELYS